MKPPAFDFVRPRSLTEALTLLSEHKGIAKIIAGGQSLVPILNFRLTAPEILIDVGRLEEISGIQELGEYLSIGAAVTQGMLLCDPLVARFAPLLVEAVPYIGHVQTRSRGTVGGSLAHADPAAEIPTVVTAIDGVLVLRSVRGERIIPAADFFVSALTSALEEDELLCEIRLPKPVRPIAVAFREITRRHGDFALVSAAVQVTRKDGHLSIAAALGGVDETPYRCPVLQIPFPASRDHVEALLDQHLSSLSPLSDIHASAGYRARLAHSLLSDCIMEACSDG